MGSFQARYFYFFEFLISHQIKAPERNLQLWWKETQITNCFFLYKLQKQTKPFA